jgi:hypothetical protein
MAEVTRHSDNTVNHHLKQKKPTIFRFRAEADRPDRHEELEHRFDIGDTGHGVLGIDEQGGHYARPPVLNEHHVPSTLVLQYKPWPYLLGFR